MKSYISPDTQIIKIGIELPIISGSEPQKEYDLSLEADTTGSSPSEGRAAQTTFYNEADDNLSEWEQQS